MNRRLALLLTLAGAFLAAGIAFLALTITTARHRDDEINTSSSALRGRPMILIAGCPARGLHSRIPHAGQDPRRDHAKGDHCLSEGGERNGGLRNDFGRWAVAAVTAKALHRPVWRRGLCCVA